MINPVNSVSNVYSRYKRVSNPNVNQYTAENCSDVFEKEISPIKLSTSGNITRINFKGRLEDPQIPAIQFKVRGVSKHQKDTGYSRDNNIEQLADSNWKDGKRLNYKIVETEKSTIISLIDPDYGEIGRVPDEIAPSLLKILRNHDDDFAFRLSNVIAGNSKSAATIGLRANLLYLGKDDTVKQKANNVFDYLLNSENRSIKDNILQYQPRTSPKEILERMFAVEGQRNGQNAVEDIRKAIDTISDEIKNPKNKNILLLGHCMPDGDTIGCVLGMHAAIKSAFPQKNVKCSIDDKIPGLFRDKLPGIEEIKRPYSLETIKNLEGNIKTLEREPQSPAIKSQVGVYKKELEYLRRNEAYFDPEVKEGASPIDYDLVILMDIPAPSRFSSSYKHYIENAKKVIYIDHHPYHYQDWNAEKGKTGIDMDKVKAENLSLVVPSVPAATQLVTVIADNAGMLKPTLKDSEKSKQFVAGIVTGSSTDTGCFSRTANLTSDDVKKPVIERPNFYPEGMAKWLIHKLGNTIDKKWLRENIVYDLSDKSDSNLGISPRQKMQEYAFDSQKIYPENGLGFVNITYEQMYDVWESAKKDDPKVTFIDVQNSFKYSEVMSCLRESPDKYMKGSSFSPYRSRYEDDKIAVLLIQDKKKGYIDEKSNLATTNGVRMSFRSQEGTNYAEMLASLFGGGGHGAAAGGRIDLDGYELNSKIAILVDGKKETDCSKIYKAVSQNFAIKNDSSIHEKDKGALMHNFQPVLDEEGRTVQSLINSITSFMRADKI